MAERVAERTRLGGRSAAVLMFVASSILLAGNGSAEGHVDARPKCRGQAATIVGTPGDDEIMGTGKADVIVGAGGMDDIFGRGGDDIICGGPGRSRIPQDDTDYQLLSGGHGDDVVLGGPDSDVLSDEYGTDLLVGRGGSDYLYANGRGKGQAGDVLRGGPGADELTGGKRGAGTLRGGSGDDLFRNEDGDHLLRGGRGNDSFESGRGDETIVGGPGVDTGSYVVLEPGASSASHCNDVTANLSTGAASGDGFGIDALRGVENVATGGGDDVLIGDDRDNTFYVGGPCGGVDPPVQRNSVAGGAGSDRIDFNSSNWDYSGAVIPVTVDLLIGSAVQRSPYDSTTLETAFTSIEDVTGTPYPDLIYGDDGPNRISGGWPQSIGPADTIHGRGGNDHLVGSDGRDSLYGEEGDDTLLGVRGNDRLDGGAGTNVIRGGPGKDHCQNPDRYNGALSCET